MDLNAYNDKFIVPRDIRRYPSELDGVPSKSGFGNKVGLRGTASFAEVASATDRAAHLQAKSTDTPDGKSGKQFTLWEKGDGFGFGDFIDIVNPLQHIPIVATVYRNFTGDQIGAAPRVIGGALWGRIGGFVTGLANAVVAWWSGKDIGDHIYTALFGEPKHEPNASAVAPNKFPLSVPVNHTAIPADAESSGAAISTSSENPWTASEVGDPNALRPEALILPPAARTSYERSRKWGEPDESLGVRFPA